jgi:hypothetical protein
MNKLIKEATISSIIVFLGGLMIYYLNIKGKNFQDFITWIPLFILPIWIIAGLEKIINKRKEKNQQNSVTIK